MSNFNKISYLIRHPILFYSYVGSKIRLHSFITESNSGIPEQISYDYMKIYSGYYWYECCQYIYALIRKQNLKIIVETGIRDGFSSWFILKALHDNGIGKLYSIEPEIKISDDKDIGWIVPNELRDKWEIVCGLSDGELNPLLNRLGCIDMFLHDSLHNYKTMLFEYETAWQYLNVGGFMVSDDVHASKAFGEFSKGKESKIYFNRLGVIKKNG